mgnify:CR=1 FL=1
MESIGLGKISMHTLPSLENLSNGLTPAKSSLRLMDIHIRFSDVNVGLSTYSRPIRASLPMKYAVESIVRFNRYAPMSTCLVQWSPIMNSNLRV